MEKNFDFAGYAARPNLKCSDGRTIMKDAFRDMTGVTVPLVWNHNYSTPENILGHAYLEHRSDGSVFAYGKFNNSDLAQHAKELVKNKDITKLSIAANNLKHNGSNVVHGIIREVSLVLCGANPGAEITNVLAHADSETDGLILYADVVDDESLMHSKDMKKKENPKMEKEKTIKDVFDELTEEQKKVVYAMIGLAVEQAIEEKKNDEGDDKTMKHNVFDGDYEYMDDSLSHGELMEIFSDAQRYGSLKDSFLAHGVTNLEYLFPDATTIGDVPGFVQRDMGWVNKVMSGVHKTPFARIKSVFADITEDDARAKGYLKGTKKKDEVFSLLKRTTSPTTVYKKQKLDRDDVIDITEIDVISWIKAEMRMMLDEEIARAILVGDGRLNSSDDKIKETDIRPIWKDDDFYTIKTAIETTTEMPSDEVAKAFIRSVVKSRKDYKGSGNPTLYTTEDVLTDCLLMEDKMGRVIYDSQEKLATALRVKEIITVPVMENLSRENEGKKYDLMGIIVNLNDYNVGADKGGAVNMFDDFDIDYNAMKYLIETRCSGALIKPYSAIAIERTPKISG